MTTSACLTVLALASCGEPAEPSPTVAPAPAATPEQRLIRLLDPGGRLYDHGQPPQWFVEDGTSGTWTRIHLSETHDHWGFDPGKLPPRSRLAVVALGCRIERTTLAEGPETVVRLRRGLPAPLRVEWATMLPQGLPAGFHELGVALERRARPDDGLGGDVTTLGSMGADWIDRDLPAKLDWTVVAPKTHDVLLYVPEPGRYRVKWVVTWGGPNVSGQSSTTHPSASVEVGPAGLAGPALVVAPRAWMEEQRAYAERTRR